MAPESGERSDDDYAAIQMSRSHFECFKCGFEAEDRDEFDTQGKALACPDCQSLRVEHVFTADDDDAELLTDGGTQQSADESLPTCETCGEPFLTETTAGPGRSKRSCGCDAVLYAVADDTDNALANVAIRALNASGDVETAGAIYEGTRERLVADGGVSWYDLHSFQRDILREMASIKADGDTSYGLGIKRGLEERYDAEVNHGRLYPNLDDLVELGLIEKSELDKRTNRYSLTDLGTEMLRSQKEAWDELDVPEVVAVADGGDGQ